MAVVGAKTIRIKVIGRGIPEPIIVFRRPTNEEMGEFLAARYSIDFTTKEVKSSQAFIARINFANMVLIGCENLEYINDDTGEIIPLTPSVSGWIDMIDPQLKADAVITAFERGTTELDYLKK